MKHYSRRIMKMQTFLCDLAAQWEKPSVFTELTIAPMTLFPFISEKLKSKGVPAQGSVVLHSTCRGSAGSPAPHTIGQKCNISYAGGLFLEKCEKPSSHGY